VLGKAVKKAAKKVAGVGAGKAVKKVAGKVAKKVAAGALAADLLVQVAGAMVIGIIVNVGWHTLAIVGGDIIVMVEEEVGKVAKRALKNQVKNLSLWPVSTKETLQVTAMLPPWPVLLLVLLASLVL